MLAYLDPGSGGIGRLDVFIGVLIGHKGSHSVVVFSCNGCSKTRRGQPHATAPDGPVWEEHTLQFCFLCSAHQVIGRGY